MAVVHSSALIARSTAVSTTPSATVQTRPARRRRPGFMTVPRPAW
jgi:hypothetical protein